MKKILVEGHRGYGAWNEKDLCKEFDKVYDTIVESKPVAFHGDISFKDLISRADKIYDLVFEVLFLGQQ